MFIGFFHGPFASVSIPLAPVALTLTDRLQRVLSIVNSDA